MYMFKTIALCFVLLSLLHSAASSLCTASAIIVETTGHWQESHVMKRVFEIHLQNTHSLCTLSDSVTIIINAPAGSHVAHTWGMDGGMITGISLAPGQTYAGPGFVLSGPGMPSATISSISKCSCPQDPTLGPSDPTYVPTSPPTQAPTPPSSTNGGPSSTGTPTSEPTTGTPTTGTPTTGEPSTTGTPTDAPTTAPTSAPTDAPTSAPTTAPTDAPTSAPTGTPAPPTPTPTPTPAPTPGSSGFYTLGLKVAIFTCNSSDIRVAVAKLINDAVGSQYDVISRATWGAGNLVLTNADGSGKYYAFVSTTELSCWEAAQQSQIANYENFFNVKMVILYTFPYPASGVTTALPAGQGVSIKTPDAATLTFAASMETSTKALVYDAEIPIPGGVDPEVFDIYAYPVTITNTSMATAAVNLNYKGQTYVAAAIIQLNNPDRTHLEFYTDQADWAVFPIVLGTAWFEWATNGLFAGARRVEFNCHADDVFMFTGMYDDATGQESEDDKNRARMIASDLDHTLAWQIATNNALAAGSNVTITFPYNYGTVEVDLGGFQKDPLFLRAMQRDVLDGFIWESHTYDHPYLDNLSYAKVTQEYEKNVPGILKLFNVTSVNDIPNYCKNSTITPSISGLFNKNAIKALLDFGFKFVVGDNSRHELIPTNLYHTLVTNTSFNGYAGLIIVPRHATNIYYDAALPVHVMEQYDHFYGTKFGPSSLDQIINRDVEVAMRALLAYRHDPFMFHQANLVWNNTVYPDNNRHCLLSYWADAVLGALKSYSSLPVISRTHDALGQVFLDREARDACGFQGVVKFDNATRSAVGLTASATGTCVFGVSGAKVVSPSKVLKYETYGPESTTWFKMTNTSNFYVDFVTPVSRI